MAVLIDNPPTWRLQLNGIGPEGFVQFNRPWFRRLRPTSVLDVGANRGQFAQVISTVLPDVPVYSFEPLPDCFDALVRLSRTYPSIRGFQVAVGDKAGTVTMFRNAYSDSSSLRAMRELHKQQFPFTAKPETEVEVQVVTLDDACRGLALGSRPFLKIDVQGFEEKVILGADAVLAMAVAAVIEVSFEPLYEGTPSFEVVCDMMRSRGFRFHGCISQLIGPLDGEILQGDALFVR